VSPKGKRGEPTAGGGTQSAPEARVGPSHHLEPRKGGRATTSLGRTLGNERPGGFSRGTSKGKRPQVIRNRGETGRSRGLVISADAIIWPYLGPVLKKGVWGKTAPPPTEPGRHDPYVQCIKL